MTVPFGENDVFFINGVLVLISPCSTIEYWKVCDEIISKGEKTVPCYNSILD